MSNSSASSTVQRPSRARGSNVRRSATIAAGVLATLVSIRPVLAQTAETQTRPFELRFTGGALVPTGEHRSSIKGGQTSAAQLSWVVRPSLAITGTFAWARSRDVAMAGSPKLDVFTSDLGVEARSGQWFSDRAVTVNPFVGFGAGARSYNYRKLDVDATNNLAGYGAVGGELGIRRVGVRLEVRDYVTGFKPLIGAGSSATRNDVVIMAGLRLKQRPTPQS